jgi:hypothetical protein
MNWRDGVDFRELVQRFDEGDRGHDLMALLNRAAFDCFHAPWETLPHPKPRGSDPGLSKAELEMELHGLDDLNNEFHAIRLPKGNLPTGEDDESNEDPERETGQRSGSGAAVPRHTSTPRTQNPLDSSEEAENLLCRLDTVLEVMGFQAHICKGTSLLLELPHDPRSDSQSLMTFRIDMEHHQFQVHCQSDLAITRISEADLDRLCRRYNRRNNGMEAGLHRHAEGARLRLRLVATLPFESMKSPASAAKWVDILLRKNRFFWRHVQRNLPTA